MDRETLTIHLNKNKKNLKEIKEGSFKDVNEAVNNFSHEINRINSKRDLLWQDIKKLHEFLEELGNVLEIVEYKNSKNETSFISEDSSIISKIEVNLIVAENEIEKIKNLGLKQLTMDFFKVGPFGAYDKKKETERMLKNNFQKLNDSEIELEKYKNDLTLKKEYINNCENIGVEYRNLINMITDFLEKIVFPEFKMIKLFLIAHTIKDNVIYGNLEKIEKIMPTKIANLSESIYKRHYCFIQNTFLLFILIQKFFSDNVITNLVGFSKNTIGKEVNNEINKIKEEIEKIADQKNLVEKNVMFVAIKNQCDCQGKE